MKNIYKKCTYKLVNIPSILYNNIVNVDTKRGDNMKDTIVKLRIDTEDKNKIKQFCEENNLTMSKLFRKIYLKVLRGEISIDEL